LLPTPPSRAEEALLFMVILKALMGWDINFGVMVLFGDDFGVLMVFFVMIK
jgi:hypothetical protein